MSAADFEGLTDSSPALRLSNCDLAHIRPLFHEKPRVFTYEINAWSRLCNSFQDTVAFPLIPYRWCYVVIFVSFNQSRRILMGMFSFIKEAGEKLFGRKEVEDTAALAASDAAAAERLVQLNAQAAQGIATYIGSQNLEIDGLSVEFDGASGAVTLQGNAASQEDSEKAALCCGNVGGVSSVNNLIAVSDSAGESQFHDVVRGDTLGAIAKEYYGNAGKYPVIFEANRPMLSHPDKIYPGQKLRIPALDD
jgi:nucleoid-associated protein YgaU